MTSHRKKSLFGHEIGLGWEFECSRFDWQPGKALDANEKMGLGW